MAIVHHIFCLYIPIYIDELVRHIQYNATNTQAAKNNVDDGAIDMMFWCARNTCIHLFIYYSCHTQYAENINTRPQGKKARNICTDFIIAPWHFCGLYVALYIYGIVVWRCNSLRCRTKHQKNSAHIYPQKHFVNG